jgi:hypothetical protein
MQPCEQHLQLRLDIAAWLLRWWLRRRQLWWRLLGLHPVCEW